MILTVKSPTLMFLGEEKSVKRNTSYLSVRFPAVRLPIKEVDAAKSDGKNYVSPSGVSFRRVSVWGVIVRKFVGEGSTMLILDDFTGTIPVLLFGELKDLEVDEGDVVRVIGMVRERNGEKRIIAEILRKITTEEEILHRLQNLLTLLGRRPPEIVEEEVEVLDVL